MKKQILLYLCLGLLITAQSQTAKTIQVNSSGTLGSLLTTTEKSTITNLVLTGKIDARDFKTMRDSMPLLSVLDMGNASISSYTGTNGTNPDSYSSTTYSSNTIPQYAFFYEVEGVLGVKNTIALINRNLETDRFTENYKNQLQIHYEFNNKLKEKFHDLTNSELKLCSLLRLNQSSKEISSLLNISPKSVDMKRYRLRKKLNIDSEKDIPEFLKNF